MNRPNFGKPPPGYVAGLGRGATGFTTRADIGPARQPSVGGDAILSGIGRGSGLPVSNDPLLAHETGQTFNAWSGYEEALFVNAGGDAEDLEADKMFDDVEDYLDGRRRDKRTKQMKKELDKIQEEAPKFQEEFADVKEKLKDVTREEWEWIPETVTRSSARAKAERYTPASDSLIESARVDGDNLNFLDPSQSTSFEQSEASKGADGDLGQARKMTLGLSLDKMSQSVLNVSGVNKNGYLTSLNSLKQNTDNEINDIKKAKLLMKSARKNYPDSPYGWISSARIEELDNNIESARKIIAQAWDKFPMSEDVWYEASRLLPPDAGKQALVKALTNMPKSKVLWIELCKREKDKEMKIKTLRKALNYISNDVELWRAAIELEDQEEAKSLLYKAIECVPYDTSIWIALAKLEEYEKARKVLNKAAKKIPTDHTLWVHAAKLEEAEGKYELVPKLIKKALKNLSGASNNLRNSGQPVVKITRDQWLKEAFEAEQSQSIVTARAIISETLYEGIEDKNDKEENKKNWTDTADNFLANGAIECSRAMHLCICKELKDDIRAWMNAINLEEKHGNIKSQGKILQQALEACNETELFYLIYAKHLWKKEKDIDKAIEVLQKGLSKITDEEELYLAIIKLYKEKRMFDDTRKILIKGRQIWDSDRIWMQSAQLEREVGNPKQALLILETAIEKYPSFYKLYLIKAQLLIEEGEYDDAREVYEKSVKEWKSHPQLWIWYSQMEQSLSNFAKARALLQKGRIKNSKNELLWLETIRLEIRSENTKVAQNLCSKALQQWPESGNLWSLAIDLEPVQQRKAKGLLAIKKIEQDPLVIISLARLFWTEKKYDKTHRWLKRSIDCNKDLGDSWAWLYKYELEQGTKESQQKVLQECIEAEPHHGEYWCSISKQVANWRLNTQEILEKVVELLEI